MVRKGGKQFVKRQFVLAISLVLVFGLLAAGLFLYLLLTPSSLELSIDGDSISADGESVLPVYVSVKNLLGFQAPFSKVVFSSDVGHFNSSGCATGLDGKCTVGFVAVKSITGQEAMVTAMADSVSDQDVIYMRGDVAKRIELSVSNSTVPANGRSTVLVTAEAYNSVNKSVPDGVQVFFTLTPSEAGNFSDSGHCTTIEGKCSVLLSSFTIPANATIDAHSGASSSSALVSFSALPPETLLINLSGASVPADGKSQVVVSVAAFDVLGNAVPGETVIATSSMGRFEERSCITDHSGSCDFVYSSSSSAGTDSIQLSIPHSSISARRSIINEPISNLEVSISLYENTGDPIIPAFARSIGYHGQDMATVRIVNKDSSVFEGSISLEILDWSNKTIFPVVIPPKGSISQSISPTLSAAAYTNLDSEPVVYQLVISDKSGKVAYRNSYRATLAPFNTMVWGSEWDDLIAAWDTPNTPEVHGLVADAASYTPWESITGYQEIPGYSHQQITYYHLKGIYDALKSRRMRYINAPFALSGAQTVYLPVQSLSVNGGNCIDGSMVFASALTSMGMDPLVVLTSNHAFICVREWHDSDYVQCVETTMMSTNSFEDAYRVGSQRFDEAQSSPNLKVINVNQVIQSGVNPLPS